MCSSGHLLLQLAEQDGRARNLDIAGRGIVVPGAGLLGASRPLEFFQYKQYNLYNSNRNHKIPDTSLFDIKTSSQPGGEICSIPHDQSGNVWSQMIHSGDQSAAETLWLFLQLLRSCLDDVGTWKAIATR